MENETWDSLPVGTKERPRLEAKDCRVEAVEKKEVGKDGKAFTKLVLHLKHPDRESLLFVSEAKIEMRGKLMARSLFLNLDTDGKIERGSAVALLLQHYQAPIISTLVGKTVRMATDEKGYLCVKCY